MPNAKRLIYKEIPAEISFNAVPKRTIPHRSFLVHADLFLVALFGTAARLTPGANDTSSAL